MTTQPQQRRGFGNYCEQRVDTWLHSLGWEPLVKNMRYPGGEIDRIYTKQCDDRVTHYCLAEIKGAVIERESDALALIWEWGLRRFVKRQQWERLLNVYNHWQTQRRMYTGSGKLRDERFTFRLIIVLVFKNREPGKELQKKLERGGYRYFKVGKRTAILSLQPDVIQKQTRASALQLELK